MFDFTAWAWGAVAPFALMTGAWLVSLRRRDAGVADPVWSLTFAGALWVYAAASPAVHGPRTWLILVMVGLWALRLAGYLTWRNLSEDVEDRRYAAMRRRHDPGFAWKSLVIVFWLQAALAWVISLPLLAAVDGGPPLSWLDALGVLLWAVGLVFETVGDAQLTRFKADPKNAGAVLDSGLWRYTRHPNYFGELLLWWGFFAVALAAGGWWSLPGPLLMSFLLLRVSGVSLLEKDIGDRRPEYAAYVRRTNAFFPWRPS